MQRWKERLRTLSPAPNTSELSILGDVVAFDYDYMRSGRKRPDPLPQLIEAHRAALHEARANHSGPIVLIGKSMGGRIGCHLSLAEKIDKLICLGFPLCAMGDRTKMRDEVLRQLTRPILFVQGTRDPLCPLDLLEEVRKDMKTPNELHIVEGGDHSLLVRKKDLGHQTQDDVDLGIQRAIANFVADLI